jgi:uncharacterized protein (DUF2062 family)
MLFSRRAPARISERMRVALWPRHGWRRSITYIAWRIFRLEDSAHGVALGIAAGVFGGCMPLVGIQTATAVLLAWVLGANIVAAVVGTFSANPLTYPLIWLASYRTGAAILGYDQLTTAELASSLQRFSDSASTSGSHPLALAAGFLWPIFKPLTVGALPVGLFAATVCYCIARPVIEAYQYQRKTQRLRPAARALKPAISRRPALGAGCDKTDCSMARRRKTI